VQSSGAIQICTKTNAFTHLLATCKLSVGS